MNEQYLLVFGGLLLGAILGWDLGYYKGVSRALEWDKE